MQVQLVLVATALVSACGAVQLLCRVRPAREVVALRVVAAVGALFEQMLLKRYDSAHTLLHARASAHVAWT